MPGVRVISHGGKDAVPEAFGVPAAKVLFHLPKISGNSREGEPVRTTHSVGEPPVSPPELPRILPSRRYAVPSATTPHPPG